MAEKIVLDIERQAALRQVRIPNPPDTVSDEEIDMPARMRGRPRKNGANTDQLDEMLAQLTGMKGVTGSIEPEPDMSPSARFIRAGKTLPCEEVTERFPDRVTAIMDTKAAIKRSITDWRPLLSKECQVYVVGEQYIAKRFDQVHYKYMGQDEAKEILIDNLYAILMYKYFPTITDEVLDRIDEIVKALTRNIKSFLTKICFNDGESRGSGMIMKRVPNTAVAFANGIFDFVLNDFIVLYDRVHVPTINNTIILYPEYIVMWNFDFDFEPLPVSITETSFEEFITIMKELNKENRNYCFELFYNMTHTMSHKASFSRMVHLSQILGYTMIPQFLQYFVLLIGSGQNGKNSLFDGCFSARVIPKPVSNSIESIEKDRFITASLENACHNIFLETSAKTYTDSNMLKALTGSMYQTIENKGINKYSGIINCKYIFAGNDQSKIKFSDATVGFRRRINIFEVFYSWDAEHHFLKYGDYYSTDFSGDLHEIKDDISNTVMFIYLAMYGIKSATKGFKSDFKFTYNEWSDAYTDADTRVRELFNETLTVDQLFSVLVDSTTLSEDKKQAAFLDSPGHTKLYTSDSMHHLGVFNFDELKKFIKGKTPAPIINSEGDETTIEVPNMVMYMSDHDLFVSMTYLAAVANRYLGYDKDAIVDFRDTFKKLYPRAHFAAAGTGSTRDSYVKIRLSTGDKLQFVDK